MSDGARVILHLIPRSAVHETEPIQLDSLMSRPEDLRPLSSHGWNQHHNLDGVLAYTPTRSSHQIESNLQIFRDGTVESVSAVLIGEWQGRKLISSPSFEEEIIGALTRYVDLQQQLDIEVPVYICLSMTCVLGYQMGVDRIQTHFFEAAGIDRDTVLLPPATFDPATGDPATALRAIFDQVWQAAGWPRSLNFTETGEWAPRRSDWERPHWAVPASFPDSPTYAVTGTPPIVYLPSD